MPVSRSSALGSKRKAQEGLPESQAQKPRLVQADCAFDQCWHETDLQRPGLISIQAILRNHHRRRLYVRPIAWVADHLRLLECYFRRIGSGGNCEESRLKASRKGESYHDTGDVSSRMSDDFPRRRLVENKEAILAAGRLCRPTSLAVKKLAVETILGTFNNIPLPSKGLTFCYHGRQAAHLPVDIVFSRNATSPTLAYLSFDSIKQLRQNHLGIARCDDIYNVPVANIKQKRLRSLEPQDKVEDPYIVALLIALAQEQRRVQQAQQKNQREQQIPRSTPQTTEPLVNKYTEVGSTQANTENTMHYIDMRLLIQHDTSSFKTQVLMFEWQPSRNLYVYTANIPPGLLDKLDNPATSFHSCPVEIRCRKIPLKHSKSVINRLHNIFCPGSCACCTG